MSDWLQIACQRLAQDGFRIEGNVAWGGQVIPAIAHRSGFSFAKFGNYEEFFVFQNIVPLTPQVVQQYSGDAFRFCKGRRSFPLPCGLFEAVGVYAVAITQNLDPATARAIAETAPAKHWGAFEFPAAYDLATGMLHYYQKTPMWGGAYYSGFRKTVQKYLSSAPG